MRGARDGSVAFRRRTGEKYGITCFRAKLDDLARQTKPLSAEYINERGNGINESFRAYVAGGQAARDRQALMTAS